MTLNQGVECAERQMAEINSNITLQLSESSKESLGDGNQRAEYICYGRGKASRLDKTMRRRQRVGGLPGSTQCSKSGRGITKIAMSRVRQGQPRHSDDE